MGDTYTRQSSGSIVDGSTIEASHFNDEFDQILAAFAVLPIVTVPESV